MFMVQSFHCSHEIFGNKKDGDKKIKVYEEGKYTYFVFITESSMT